MKPSKIFRIVLAVTLVIWIALEVHHWLTPQPIMGSLTLTMGAETNRAGEVLFLVTNTSRWEIQYWTRTEVLENGLWPLYPFNRAHSDLGKEYVVRPGQAASFYVLPPSNGNSWRVWVDYRAATERDQKVLTLRQYMTGAGIGNIGQKIPLDLGGYVLYPESNDPFNRKAQQ